MTPQEIRDLILNKAEKKLNEISFATYFSDNVLIDLLVNAIVNRKCITFFSTKRNQFDTYKGVPYIERGEIMFKFSLPLIENYMQWNFFRSLNDKVEIEECTLRLTPEGPERESLKKIAGKIYVMLSSDE